MTDIVIITPPKFYNENVKENIYRYRDLHKEQYKQYQREYYQRVRSQDPEKQKKFRIANNKAVKKFYDKKKIEKNDDEKIDEKNDDEKK